MRCLEAVRRYFRGPSGPYPDVVVADIRRQIVADIERLDRVLSKMKAAKGEVESATRDFRSQIAPVLDALATPGPPAPYVSAGPEENGWDCKCGARRISHDYYMDGLCPACGLQSNDETEIGPEPDKPYLGDLSASTRTVYAFGSAKELAAITEAIR